MPRPCLPMGGKIIDVMDETKLPAGLAVIDCDSSEDR